MPREWQRDYNHDRPHKSLKYKTPATYFKQWLNRDMKPNESNEALSTSVGGDPSSLRQLIVGKIFEKTTVENHFTPLILNTTN